MKRRKPRTVGVASVAAAHARVAGKRKRVKTEPVDETEVDADVDAAMSTAAGDLEETREMKREAKGVAVRGANGGGGGGEDPRKRKGLRHFAVRVSKKVEEKGSTTYNEVADELVTEEKTIRLLENASSHDMSVRRRAPVVDEKNIRRRVYDSLNVLMAMGIIEKERKAIRWCGLSAAAAFVSSRDVRAQLNEQRRVVERKRAFLMAVRDQANALDALVQRNRQLHTRFDLKQLTMPFLVVSTAPDTKIDLQIDAARRDVLFTLDDEFSIYDDREILRRLHLPPPLASIAHAPSRTDDDEGGVPSPSRRLTLIRPTSPPLVLNESTASSIDKSMSAVFDGNPNGSAGAGGGGSASGGGKSSVTALDSTSNLDGLHVLSSACML